MKLLYSVEIYSPQNIGCSKFYISWSDNNTLFNIIGLKHTLSMFLRLQIRPNSGLTLCKAREYSYFKGYRWGMGLKAGGEEEKIPFLRGEISI